MADNKALFLDLDGTVRETKSGKPCPDRPSDQKILPGRRAKIQEYKRNGYKIIGVTNQGGIGLGYMTRGQCEETLDDLDRRLGSVFDKILYEGAAPNSGHHRTKPNPGMLDEAKKEFGLDMGKSIMVGDKDTDRQAAQRAGVPFKWSRQFFG